MSKGEIKGIEVVVNKPRIIEIRLKITAVLSL
jgi:hypothetical protein